MVYSFDDPALSPQNINQGNQYPQGQPVPQQGQPILIDPAQPNPQPPALSGNARMSSKTPAPPPGQIQMSSEGLIRIGSAGLQAASDPTGSGGNWMAAMGNKYGEIQDYNRQATATQFEIEESRRTEAARRADIQRRMNSSGNSSAAKKPTNGADMIMAQESLNELTTLISALEDGGLTGPVDGTILAWLDRSGMRDYFMGDDAGAKRAYYRQRLENYRVNEALAVTANTKGAISDKEMALFLAPIPATADTTEATWIFHLREKLRINSKILAFEQGAASGGGDFSFVD